jgi:4-amino-4-deoxy-L-arabinose transferase-like glycosyltransferase
MKKIFIHLMGFFTRHNSEDISGMGEKEDGGEVDKRHGKKTVMILVIAIVLFSAVIRFYQIDRFPVNFGAFEGIAGHSAIQVAEGDDEAIQAVWHRAKQPLWGSVGIAWNPFLIYPMSVVYRVMGFDLSHIGIRIVPILYGVLSVLIIYHLMAGMFGPEVGLVSSFLLAITPWFITLSRVCNDFSATIFFSLLCYWVYSRSRRNVFKYILLGGLMGLSTYFYPPARIVPVIVVLSILTRCIFERGYLKSTWLGLILMILSFQLVCQAQGISMTSVYTDICKKRANECSWKRPNLARTMQINCTSFYDKFFINWGWVGTSELAYERDGAAIDPVSRWFVAVGLLLAILRIRDHRYRFLIIWAIGSILPLIFTCARTKRGLLVIPALSALGAVGLCGIIEILTRWANNYEDSSGKMGKVIGAILIFSVLIIIGIINLHNYFGEYIKNESILLKKRDKWPSYESTLKALEEKDLYTDCWMGELYRSGEYLSRCVGKGNHLYQLPPEEAKKQFNESEGPALLYLKSGEREEK